MALNKAKICSIFQILKVLSKNSCNNNLLSYLFIKQHYSSAYFNLHFWTANGKTFLTECWRAFPEFSLLLISYGCNTDSLELFSNTVFEFCHTFKGIYLSLCCDFILHSAHKAWTYTQFSQQWLLDLTPYQQLIKLLCSSLEYVNFCPINFHQHEPKP